MRFAPLALAIACFAATPTMSAEDTQEPAHDIIVAEGAFEIRAYKPMIVAEVVVTGDMQRAGSSGFRPLADYIFGNNTAKSEIAMTAPVTRTPASQEIAMTAPVMRTPAEADSWTVAFVMPEEWTMETLPIPNNPNVKLREKSGETIATIRFDGRGQAKTYASKQADLEAWIMAQGYIATAPARFAGYSAPWVPAPLKRHEVMIPVTKAE